MSLTTQNPRAARPTARLLTLPALSDRHPRRAVTLLCVVGAVVFLASLGRSSLFIDEVFSWNAARGNLGGVADAIHYAEVTPPLYYLFLHLWIGVTGESEIMLRLPSALAGVGLIGATWWLGFAVGGRRVATVAGLLTALSPLVLNYAQQVRAYVFVMLAVTIAAAAVVEWTREPERRVWPLVAGVAAAAAILLHYTAALALVPIVVWALTRAELSGRSRLLFAAGCALPALALVPLLALQAGVGHHDGAEEYARITKDNLFAVVGTPFDGRAASGSDLARQLGALVVADAVALLAFGDRFRGARGRGLLVAGALVPIVAVVVTSVLVHPLALTRYTTIATPFMLVAVAVVVVGLPRLLGALVGGLALLACVAGIAGSLTNAGQHPDTRDAVSTAAADWQAGDALFGVGYLGFDGSLDYYADRELPGSPGVVKGYPSMAAALGATEVRDQLADGNRIWFVSDPVLPERDLKQILAQVDYVPLEHRAFTGTADVQLVLAGPGS